MKRSIQLTTIVGALGLFLAALVLKGPAFRESSAQAAAPHTPQLESFWYEDFSVPLQAEDYYIVATAGSGVQTSNYEFRLTEAANSENGRIFYLTRAWMDEFVANFSLKLGHETVGNPIADGAAFIFCPFYDYAPSGGPFLDASCPGGYIVAFDTYENDDKDRIYVAFGNTNSRICESNPLEPIVLANGNWHDFSVTFDNNTIEVSLDGRTPWVCALPGYQPFVGYFGFGASTGGYYAEQLVDNISIDANPPRNYLPLVSR